VVGAQGGVRARLLALQVCLACLLIVLGLHASRGVIARMQSRATFDVDGIIVAELQSWGVREIRDSVDRKEYVENAERILRALPGVQMTSPTPSLEPVEGIAGRRAMILLPGSAQKRVQLQKVRLDYFRTLGVGMRQGQLPRTVPTLQGRRTAVVNRAFIDSVGRNVVGSTVHVVDYGDVFVVAEVNGINAASGGQGWPAMYELASEGDFGLGSGYLIARVQKGSEKAVVAAYARAMRSQYPRMVPPSTGSLKSRIDVYTAPQRYVARAALMFGGAELILAAIGLYSILLYQVLTRTREIGVRMALGAAPSRASYAVLQEAFSSVGIGLVLGMIVSIPGSIIAARNFPGAELRDIVPVTVAVISILAAAAAACIVPARRAARVQPMDALRHE
jgi:hypothetical protein